MKKKQKKNKLGKSMTIFLLFVMSCFAFSCKDDEVDSKSHDPSKPVEITDFSPKNGSARTRLFIYGKNFGTDISQIMVKIGGVDAKVIGSNGECIYCVVPQRAFDGTIEVSIGGENQTPVIAEAAEKFAYEKKSLVTTLCGTVSETGEYTVTDGAFEKAGFKYTTWLSFDPHNPNYLYTVEDYAGIRLIDLEKREVSTVITCGQMNIARPRTITWSPDGNIMYVSNDQGSEDGISNIALGREENFLRAEVVTRSRSCNGSAVHPVNGEIYYSQWEGGSIWRDDLNDDKPREELFKIWANGYEIGIIFHPTGNYAYLMGHNFHAIVKSTYNWEKKQLEVPQPFVGDFGKEDWIDGVGTQARLKNPWQGVFVKNSEYVKQGKSDEYDFYFCDRHTCTIRKITPEGMVVTIAGRGSEGLDSNYWGYVDGDLRKEARFNQPVGIAYSEENSIFYVADAENRRIRTITIENETDTVEADQEAQVEP